MNKCHVCEADNEPGVELCRECSSYMEKAAPVGAPDSIITSPPSIPSSEEPMATLVVEGGPYTGSSYIVKRSKTFGREQGADFIFPDNPSMSAPHAVLEISNTGFFIQDLKKVANPTLVNGQPLPEGEKKQLNLNDRIKLGRSFFVVENIITN